MIEINRKKIARIIERHKGCTKLGKELGVSRAVVDSWRARGVVPSWVLLAHPVLFKGIKTAKMLKDAKAL
jgi:hypothetical protein